MVTTVLEHNSLRPLYEMEKLGAELVIVGCEKAEEMLMKRKKSG